MSSFRLICITTLSTVMLVVAAGAAVAQTATSVEQSGTYLAGLRPPHDPHKSAHLKTTQPGVQHTPMAKSTRLATKQRQVVTAKVKLHRPVRLADKRLADKINSRVAWPSVELPAADQRDASDTVLQFASEDTAPNPAPHRDPAPHPAATAPTSTVKPPPPAAIVATDERKFDSDVTGTMPGASTPVQTERFEASASRPMRVIMPATNMPAADAEPLASPAIAEQPRSNSVTAQMLATLAGAITAAIVGWLLIGPRRTIRSRQT